MGLKLAQLLIIRHKIVSIHVFSRTDIKCIRGAAFEKVTFFKTSMFEIYCNLSILTSNILKSLPVSSAKLNINLLRKRFFLKT